MTEQEIKELFARSQALLEGHFLLSSGLHSPRYLQCALVLADPPKAESLGRALAALCPERPDLVLSPAMGGLIIGHEVGRALGVKAYFTEREEGAMTLRRGFALEPGQKVAVIEDVITTGLSSGEVIELVRRLGARPIAALSIINRSSQAPSIGVPVRSLLKLEIPTYETGSCPLCREGVALVKPGSRKRQQPC